jgi:hypothetical protein
MRLKGFCVILVLAATCVWAADSVVVTPPKPNTGDSLHIDLFSASRCCASVYYQTLISVSDTTIVLSYQYDDSLCAIVRCFVAGDHLQYATGPVAAGRYGIYESSSQYCRGPICALGPIMFTRVGEVTVSRPTSVIPNVLSVRTLSRPSRVVYDASANRILVTPSAGSGRFSVDGRSMPGERRAVGQTLK